MARLKYFPERLKQARKERGWSVAELSKISGIPTSTISRYESGEGAPNLYVVMELCRTLDVSMKELTGL